METVFSGHFKLCSTLVMETAFSGHFKLCYKQSLLEMVVNLATIFIYLLSFLLTLKILTCSKLAIKTPDECVKSVQS